MVHKGGDGYDDKTITKIFVWTPVMCVAPETSSAIV